MWPRSYLFSSNQLMTLEGEEWLHSSYVQQRNANLDSGTLSSNNKSTVRRAWIWPSCPPRRMQSLNLKPLPYSRGIWISSGQPGVHFRIASLLFADDMLLLVSSSVTFSMIYSWVWSSSRPPLVSFMTETPPIWWWVGSSNRSVRK